MNNQFLNSLTLEVLEKSRDIKRNIEVLMIYFRAKLEPDSGQILVIDGDKTIADYVSKIEVVGANGNICTLKANDLLAIAQSLGTVRPADFINVTTLVANNDCYFECLIPIFCGQYVDSVNFTVNAFATTGLLVTPDSGSITPSNNKIDIYAVEGFDGLTPFEYGLGNKTISATGQDTYVKDQLKKPVKGIVVRTTDSSDVPTDILSQLLVTTDSNQIVYNVKNDNLLKRQQEYFNKIPIYSTDKKYAAGVGILEYSRRNRPVGEFHIMFDTPITANSLTLDFTADGTGKMRVLFIY